jgi:MOSC domain-containing protein YiiM
MAGVYGAVLVEGMLHKGDPVELLEHLVFGKIESVGIGPA